MIHRGLTTITLPRAAAPFFTFGRLLRRFGFSIAPEQIVDFMRATTLLGPRSMNDIREAALATLAPPPDRRAEFAAHFRSHFYGEAAAIVEGEEDDDETRVKDDGGPRQEKAEVLREENAGELSSAAERLGDKTFEHDGDRLVRFSRDLPAALPMRRSFRTVRTASRGTLDLRRSLREIVGADGDVPVPLLRRRKSVPRRILMLIDVSGSMKLHTQDYLAVAHTVVQGAAAAEIFTFGTRLTRITRSLRVRDRGQALARTASQVDDWDGGTRIGPTLLALLSVPRFSSFARGAAVIILSDALERGDHAEMVLAFRRLGARAFRLSLCTPLAGDPRFRPRTAALQAILPLLDDLVDGSSIAALTEFILSLARPPRAGGRNHMAECFLMQKIIDSHFHIWRREDLPWLVGAMVPRIFGPYEPIRRDYPIEEFLADNEDSGVEKAVYVQTNWARDDFEKEVAWVQQTADETGWPHAIVGYADMTVDDVRPQLDRLRNYPLLRGVRMQLHWHETPEYRFASSADQVIDPKVRANVSHLKDYDLSFDLQLFPKQMRDGAELVGENPDTNFVLTHAGMLTDMSVTDEWQDGLRALAASPNLFAKLSGLGTFVHRNDPELIAFIVGKAVDILGSDRLMFGSNFPIEKLWTDHAALVEAHRNAVALHGAAAERDIFWNTAQRIYRVE